MRIWKIATLVWMGLTSAALAASEPRNELLALAAELESRLGCEAVRVEIVPAVEEADQPLPRATLFDGSRYQSLDPHTLIEAMNRERRRSGLPLFRANDRLTLAARDRIDDMIRKRYFDHVAPDGKGPFSWVRQRRYRYRHAGENLAMGFRSADDVVKAWMKSPEHRANLLGDYHEVGIASIAGAPTDSRPGHTIVAIYGRR